MQITEIIYSSHKQTEAVNQTALPAVIKRGKVVSKDDISHPSASRMACIDQTFCVNGYYSGV